MYKELVVYRDWDTQSSFKTIRKCSAALYSPAGVTLPLSPNPGCIASSRRKSQGCLGQHEAFREQKADLLETPTVRLKKTTKVNNKIRISETSYRLNLSELSCMGVLQYRTAWYHNGDNATLHKDELEMSHPTSNRTSTIHLIEASNIYRITEPPLF